MELKKKKKGWGSPIYKWWNKFRRIFLNLQLLRVSIPLCPQYIISKDFKNLGNLHAQGTIPKKLLDARNRRAHRQHCIKTGIILSRKSPSVNTVHRAIHKSKEEAMWARSRNSSLGLSLSKTYWGKVENWSEIRRIGNWNSFWKTMEKRSCPSCWQQSVQKHLWWYGCVHI